MTSDASPKGSLLGMDNRRSMDSRGLEKLYKCIGAEGRWIGYLNFYP